MNITLDEADQGAVVATLEDYGRIVRLTREGHFTPDMPWICAQAMFNYTRRIIWLRWTYPLRRLIGRSGPRKWKG